MDKYPVGHKLSQAGKPKSLESYRFQSMDGQQTHEWHITQVRLVFFTDWHWDDETPSQRSESESESSVIPSESETDASEYLYKYWRGLYMFDQDDAEMAVHLKELMVENDRPNTQQAEVYQGLGQIIQDVLYLISSKWTQFFDEADDHLRFLVSLTILFSWLTTTDPRRANSASPKSFLQQGNYSICGSCTNYHHSGPASADT